MKRTKRRWIALMLGLGLAPFMAFAQNISISKKQAALYDVINEIRNQSGYDFLLNGDLLKKATPITINVSNVSVKQALDAAFKNQPFLYEIKNNNTVIIKAKNIAVNMQLTVQNTTGQLDKQQENLIKGRVIDTLGKPLAGVSVRIKNEPQQVMTDQQGAFSILAKTSGKVTLTFRYVGLQSLDQVIHENRQNNVIVMHTEHQKVEDVIITGYSTIRKESFTGNAIRVDKQDLLNVGNRNVLDILQVYDPSFRIETNNLRGSDPNSLPEFYIRGRSGIGVKELDQNVDLSQGNLTNNPNLPIFIMDGYEVSAQRVYDFDINQIKSVTILKDAAATAVYGSRAANGVIVIETVPPIPGKLRFSYTGVGTLTAPDLSDYNLMNAAEKLEAERLAGYYTIKPTTLPANAVLLTDEFLKKQSQVNRGVNSDWIAQPLRNEINQKHSLNIDGGTEQVRFGLSLRADRQSGVMKKSARNRNGAGLSVEYRLGKYQVRNDVNVDIVESHDSPYGKFSDYTTKAPYDEIFDANGNVQRRTMVWHTGGTDLLNLVNPLYEAANTKNYSKGNNSNITNNFSWNGQVIPKLHFRGSFSVTKNNTTNETYVDPASGRYNIDPTTDFAEIGELNQRRSDALGLNLNALVNYLNQIGNHNINLSLGLNALQNENNAFNALYTGFASGDQHSPNLANKIKGKPTNAISKSRLFGTFLTMNYSFKDIYLFDVSSRLDGSSEFGTEKKYAPFWSFGTGLNLHKYEFMENLPFINRARITANTGQLGKTNFPPFAAKNHYVISNDWYSTGPGVSLYYMGNPALTWEKTKTFDVITDFGLFNDRLNLNFNLYHKKTENLVNDIDLPLSSGFAQYKGNIGEVVNKGFEINVRYMIIRQKDVNVSVFGNLAANSNRITNISNALKAYNNLVDKQYDNFSPAGSQRDTDKKRFSTPHIKYVEGGTLYSLFGMQSLGINPMDGQELFLRKDGTITGEWNAADQQIIANTAPKAQGTFGFNIFYKNITVMGTFMYEYGKDEYNHTLLNKVENIDIYNNNADRRFLYDRWKQPGDIARFKNIAELSWTTRPTSRFVQRANSITMNSLSVGYTFNPQKLKSIAKINMLRIQANTNNVFKISTVKQERGLEYPFARTFDLSINLGF
ncbi:SusC/RagA family TonB-linked outer membrane protein [Sphingobacterium sp. Mn56C]|uniref:SusC/RagA family TonB-linked outer membrane protein n=1 Tax=Sphingobacterium sp. Mn56C TaxID=3395261 RepID=UPI003BE3D19B